MPRKKTYSNDGAADYLDVSARTTEAWRSKGMGPKYIRLGGSKSGPVRYLEEHLDEYLESRLQIPRGEAA